MFNYALGIFVKLVNTTRLQNRKIIIKIIKQCKDDMYILVEKICHNYPHSYFCKRWLTDIKTVNTSKEKKMPTHTFKEFLYFFEYAIILIYCRESKHFLTLLSFVSRVYSFFTHEKRAEDFYSLIELKSCFYPPFAIWFKASK